MSNNTESAPSMRAQLIAIAWLRWRIFSNSLRSKRGRLELFSRVIVSLAFAGGGFGGAVLMAVGAYYFVTKDQAQYLAILLWPVFLFWQGFPVMATAFTNNPDSSELLRFPLSYRSYFLIRLAYGAFDPATALGSSWLLGILLGLTVARPALLPWVLVVLLAFAAFNLLFMQMIFAWVERWLAQRRTREIMGVFFVLLMLSFQLIGPMVQRFEGKRHAQIVPYLDIVKPVQAALPPGLAADALARAFKPDFFVAASSFLLLSAFTLAAGYLLHLRLRAQFRGENLSEVSGVAAVQKAQGLSLGWRLPGLPSTVAAVFEKEVRYLTRSGPMLLTLIMPLFMLVVFRLGPMSQLKHNSMSSMRTPNMAFPAAGAYALLVLTNLIYNNFGADGAGIQFFFTAPVRFREIVLGKNLTHAGILVANAVLAWLAVTYLYARPALDVTIATIVGLGFAAPLNFTVGNLLSLYSPKRVEFATFGRQRVSQVTVLISLGVQFVVVALVGGTFWVARSYQNFWIAVLVLLPLAAISFTIYGVALHYVDQVAFERRETLVSELSRA